MNKEQLEGYLLACCDIIDRMIETGQLKEDDVAGKLSENLREYIRLNNTTNYSWYKPYIQTTSENIKWYCQNCGKELKENEFHICCGSRNITSGSTK